jgi:hypothetical protein
MGIGGYREDRLFFTPGCTKPEGHENCTAEFAFFDFVLFSYNKPIHKSDPNVSNQAYDLFYEVSCRLIASALGDYSSKCSVYHLRRLKRDLLGHEW